jgi:predicted transposase YdaD
MIIANPLYDTAFKKLINDPDVAKALIGTLLETEVLKVEPRVTEHIKPMAQDDKRPKCFRVDYAALIKNEKGEEQKILIEVQKASGADNIMRFRQYLAVAGYMKKEEESALPIVTIYFLGFKLENVHTSCLKVARQYVDMLENKVLETKEKFVELLTHDSVIIQVPRIKTFETPKTELEKILSVFEQKDFADENETTMDYKYPVEDDDNLKKMVGILNYISSNPEERKEMDNEAYWHWHDENTVGKLLKVQEELEEKDKKLEEKDKKLEEKDKKLEEMQKKALEVAKKMKQRGIPAEEVAELTGLTASEIENL